MHGHRGGEQGRDIGTGRSQERFGTLDLAFLIEIRGYQPLVQVERVARRGEDRAPVDNAQRMLHAQTQAFQNGGEVPGVDRLTIDTGLTADRLKPGAIEKSGRQGVAGQSLVEPGDGGGGVLERAGEPWIEGSAARLDRHVEQGDLPNGFAKEFGFRRFEDWPAGPRSDDRSPACRPTIDQ